MLPVIIAPTSTAASPSPVCQNPVMVITKVAIRPATTVFQNCSPDIVIVLLLVV